MSRPLQLESFRRQIAPAPPPPGYDAADLAAARAEGWAEGAAAARDTAAEAVAGAVSGLASALTQDDARMRQAAVLWSAELGLIARAIVQTLAGPLRGAALADRLAAALTDELALGAPPPSVIRCEAAATAPLEAALRAAAINGIAVQPCDAGAEFIVGDGILRIEPAQLETTLNHILAEIGAADGSE